MLVVFMIPKRNSGQTLYTMAPALTTEQVAEQSLERCFNPGAEYYDDEILITDWDGTGHCMLDPEYCYLTIDADEAIERFLPVIENRTDDPYLFEVADAIVSMIVDAENVEIHQTSSDTSSQPSIDLCGGDHSRICFFLIIHQEHILVLLTKLQDFIEDRTIACTSIHVVDQCAHLLFQSIHVGETILSWFFNTHADIIAHTIEKEPCEIAEFTCVFNSSNHSDVTKLGVIEANAS